MAAIRALKVHNNFIGDTVILRVDFYHQLLFMTKPAVTVYVRQWAVDFNHQLLWLLPKTRLKDEEPSVFECTNDLILHIENNFSVKSILGAICTDLVILFPEVGKLVDPVINFEIQRI